MYRCILEVTTLDHFVSHNGLFPRLIKIDVEGAQSHVLTGSEKVDYSN